jgi:glycine cleavage system aminomethyltransferase T
LASYLVYSALVQDAITALEYYAFQRTGNIKVKASPSKQRYVAYFERMRKLEKMGLKLQSNELRVDKIAIQGLHSAKKLCKLKIIDGNRNYEVLHIEVIEKSGVVIKFNKKCVISGDTVFQFYFENKVVRLKKPSKISYFTSPALCIDNIVYC